VTTIAERLDIDFSALAWREDAACARVDPELFDGGDIGSPADYRQARAICRNCPVARECLTHALESDERYGMWGGLTPNERKEINSVRRSLVPRPTQTQVRTDHIRRALKVLAAHRDQLAEGRNNHDIAAAIGISPKSYSARLTRARRLLERHGVAVPS
jgi:WhiB family redox-sensing transcriptional regulator